MRGASLADLHLGARRGTDLTGGRNTRELDVENAWFHAVRQIIEADVDVVTIAGDVFEHPRVSDYAKRAFLTGLKMLKDEDIPTVVLQGNHDAGKTADTLTPIMLADEGDFYIVTTPERIRLPGASIACFPYVSRGTGEAYRLDPDPDVDVNVLVMHAAVKGSADGDALPYFYGSDAQALDIGRQADRWDVIAVGDYHEFTRLHPERLAFYSGSIERTSTNMWAETAPKGWVLWDTNAGTLEFREIPTREWADYTMADFGLSTGADDVNRALGYLRDARGDRIVRLKVEGFPREERQSINWALVREVKRLCTHFELDIRYAKGEERVSFERGSEGLKRSLRAEAEKFLADDDAAVRDLVLAHMDASEDL